MSKNPKPDWKSDNAASNGKCPNGHDTQVNVTVKGGQGRVFCPTCHWNDSQQTLGTDSGRETPPSIHEVRQPTKIIGGATGGEGVKIVTVTVRYLCCSYEHTGDSTLTFHEVGYLVCPDHGQRRYGWRSAPILPRKVAKHPDSTLKEDEFVMRPDYTVKPPEADALFVANLRKQLAHVELVEAEIEAEVEAEVEVIEEALAAASDTERRLDWEAENRSQS